MQDPEITPPHSGCSPPLPNSASQQLFPTSSQHSAVIPQLTPGDDHLIPQLLNNTNTPQHQSQVHTASNSQSQLHSTGGVGGTNSQSLSAFTLQPEQQQAVQEQRQQYQQQSTSCVANNGYHLPNSGNGQEQNSGGIFQQQHPPIPSPISISNNNIVPDSQLIHNSRVLSEAQSALTHSQHEQQIRTSHSQALQPYAISAPTQTIVQQDNVNKVVQPQLLVGSHHTTSLDTPPQQPNYRLESNDVTVKSERLSTGQDQAPASG